MLPGRGRTPPGDRLSLSHGGKWWEAILEGRRESLSMARLYAGGRTRQTSKKNREKEQRYVLPTIRSLADCIWVLDTVSMSEVGMIQSM